MSRRVEHRLAKGFKSAHWGLEPEVIIEHEDRAALPDSGLIQMGSLVTLEVQPNLDRPGSRRGVLFLDFKSEYENADIAKRSHLAYAPTKDRRLYNLLSTKSQSAAKRLINPRAPFYSLDEIASWAPGRQNQWTYPALQCQPVGWVQFTEYWSEKKETESTRGQGGRAVYRHEQGEVTGQRPILAVDRTGRLLWAGGGYTVIPGGIKN